MHPSIHAAAAVLRGRERILVFTGAGISTESGIPDFRGPDGVWKRVDPAEFTIDRYLSNAETRRRSWEMRFFSGVLDAGPNAAHHAVTGFWAQHRMIGCVTQNIDGLHQAAGLPAEAVIELHGNARLTRCVRCNAAWPTEDIRIRFEGGDTDPHCEHCGGILKVDVVMFGEMLPDRAMRRAMEWADSTDAVLAIGSTLSVYPAAMVPLAAVRAGAPLVIVNRGETEHDLWADAMVDGSAGEVLPGLLEALAEEPG